MQVCKVVNIETKEVIQVYPFEEHQKARNHMIRLLNAGVMAMVQTTAPEARQVSRPSLTDMHTLDDLAAWAASNHQGGFMPTDWLPLLLQAQLIAIRELRTTPANNGEVNG